jgi:Histidine phosphatase superfamily (branch 2)
MAECSKYFLNQVMTRKLDVFLYTEPSSTPKDSVSRSRDSLSDGVREPSLVLILKWGGELTPAGKIQAEELGKAFRCMYPGGQGKVICLFQFLLFLVMRVRISISEFFSMKFASSFFH